MKLSLPTEEMFLNNKLLTKKAKYTDFANSLRNSYGNSYIYDYWNHLNNHKLEDYGNYLLDNSKAYIKSNNIVSLKQDNKDYLCRLVLEINEGERKKYDFVYPETLVNPTLATHLYELYKENWLIKTGYVFEINDIELTEYVYLNNLYVFLGNKDKFLDIPSHLIWFNVNVINWIYDEKNNIYISNKCITANYSPSDLTEKSLDEIMYSMVRCKK